MYDFSIVTRWIDSLLRHTLNLGDFWSILIECVLVGICILTAYALIAIVLIFMERKVCAYFQCRLGPMRVGPWGIFQVFADLSAHSLSFLGTKVLQCSTSMLAFSC